MIMKRRNKSEEKKDENKSDPFLDEFLSTSEPVESDSIEKESVPSEKIELQEDALHCEFEGDIAIVRKVIKQLTTVYDPEIPVNIYDLGLIYKIKINEDDSVFISMTLTAPGCPVAHLFPSMVKGAVESIDEIDGVEVEIIWDPPWTQERMTDAAKLELGMF
jgi:FeS assembly SUF system protein